MPNLKGTTRAQTIFLREFAKSTDRIHELKWPAPSVLRRWMRKPGFAVAMQSMREALRYQADFQLLATAAAAARTLQSSVTACESDQQIKAMRAMSDLLKLAHLRQRFTQPEPYKAEPTRRPPIHLPSNLDRSWICS